MISDALKNDLKDVFAIDIDEENELGGLPSADVNSEPYHPSPENALLHNQYAIPPDDLFTNSAYDSRIPQIERWQEDAFTKMAAIPTINNQKVHFIRMWLPFEASKAPDFKLWLGSLRYCPTTVQNFCGDGKGGFMSPMGAMFGNGKLRSASWGVIQLIFEHLYWMFGKMNTTPIVKAYKGSVYSYYTKKNYELLQKIYADFVEKVFSVCDKIMFFSKGVLTELEEMFGTKKYDKIINNLLRDEKVLSLAKDKVETIHHPEKLVNIIYRDNSFEWLCKRYNAFGTLAKREMTGDMSLVCTVGTDIFNEVKDSEAYKLMIEACRQALLRAQKIVKAASAMDKSGDFGGMTDSHLRVLENWNLKRIASRMTIGGEMSKADMVVVQGIAKARAVGVEKVLATVQSHQQSHQRFSASSRLASAGSRGEVVDIEAAANCLNTTKERLEKRIKAHRGAQKKLGTSSTLAAARGRGKDVDMAAHAKDLNMSKEDLEKRVNTQQGTHDLFTVARKFAARQQKGNEMFDVNNEEIQKASKELGIPPSNLINNIESFVKGRAVSSKARRNKDQLDLLEAGGKGKKTVHRASCNKCTNIGEETIKFVSSTKPNVRCHGDCPSNCHRDFSVDEEPLSPEECRRLHAEMKRSTTTQVVSTNVVSSSSGVDTDTDVSIMTTTSINMSSWSEDTVTSLVNNGVQVIAIMSGNASFDRDNQMFYIEGQRSADQDFIQSTRPSLSDTFELSTACQTYHDMTCPPGGKFYGSFDTTFGNDRMQVQDSVELYFESGGVGALVISGEGESGVGRYKVVGMMTRRGELAMIHYSDNYSNMSSSQRELALQLNQDPSQLSIYEQSELISIVNGMLNPSDEINDWLNAIGDDKSSGDEVSSGDKIAHTDSANIIHTLRRSDAPILLVDSPATNSLGNYESSDEDDGYDTDDLCQSSTGSDDSDNLSISDESSSSVVDDNRESRVFTFAPLFSISSESVDPQAGMRVAMRFNNGNHYPGTIINVHPVHPIQPGVGLTVTVWLDDSTMETYAEYPSVDIRLMRNSSLSIAFDRILFPLDTDL